MPLGDMLKKLRGYNYLIKRYKKNQDAWGLHPIRAVLIEAPDEKRCLKLMELAWHPLVCGQSKRSGLFWFVPSFVFTTAVERGGTSSTGAKTMADRLPGYLAQPDGIFQPQWGLPETLDDRGHIASVSKHSLLDGENSVR